MRIDLGGQTTIDRLAGSGIERVEAVIRRRTGGTAATVSSSVELLSMDALCSAGADQDPVGVRAETSGGLEAAISLVIDAPAEHDGVGDGREGANATGAEPLALPVELLDAFLDGLAEHLGSPIGRTDAMAIQGPRTSLAGREGSDVDRAFGVFEIAASYDVADRPLEVRLHLRPSREDLEWLLAAPSGGSPLPLSAEQLAVYDHLTSAGTERASANLSALTGMETRVEVSRSCLLPIEAVVSRIGEERYVGVAIESFGALSGHVLVLFPEPSARAVAATLVGAALEDDAITAIHRSAIEEVGNIITSGLVDGWAELVGATIEIRPPRFVDDRGPPIVGSILDRLGPGREFAFVMDSTVVIDGADVNCEILAIPDEEEFSRTLSRVAGAPGSPGPAVDDHPGGPGESYGGS